MTYHYPCLQECTEYITKKDTSRTPTVLKNPFPAQQQQNLIANQPQAPQGGNDGLQHPSSGEGSSTVYTFEMVDL